MELIKCKYRIRCELGACGRRAAYTLVMPRAGLRANVHICAECLGEIAVLGGEALYKESTV